MKRLSCLLILLALACATDASGRDDAPDTDGTCRVTISGIENEHTHTLAAALLREAYDRIGCELVLEFVPGKRSLLWADEGVTDGDIARIKGTEDTFTNLLRVDAPVAFFTGAAFTIHETRTIASWEDLRGLRIGIIRGIRYSQLGTRGMEPVQANDMTHLFTLLVEDRIDVAVSVLDAGLIEAASHFRDSGIHVVGSPLHISPLYHYLNRSRADLVTPLENTLKAMWASGEANSIMEQARQQLLAH